MSAFKEEAMEQPNATTTSASGASTQRDANFVVPPVDVLENKEELIVYVDLPGVKKEDITIHLDKDQLLIDALRPTEESRAKPLMTEYRHVNFRRRFALQQGTLEADKVTADLQDGVLRLALPKAARMKPRIIPVTSG